MNTVRSEQKIELWKAKGPDAGNEALKNMKPENEPIGVLLGALDYYINNGIIQPLRDGIFNKQ